MHRVLARSYLDKIHWPSRKEVSLKYADNNDWIELHADDLDSFIDMIETAKDSARENYGAPNHSILYTIYMVCSTFYVVNFTFYMVNFGSFICFTRLFICSTIDFLYAQLDFLYG